MKLIHIADLHLGKSMYGLSLLESGDQAYWVDSFLSLMKEEQPDAVLIAGDVYDRSMPGQEAVTLLDHLLTGLAAQSIPVFMVAGNHDSGPRLNFAHSLLATANVHISGVVHKELDHITLNDSYGPVTFWLLPYTFPEQIRVLLMNEEIHNYDQAVRALIALQPIDKETRNVLIAHQNVITGEEHAHTTGSESVIGGVGEIDASAFDDFDYVALGHIHSSYPVLREGIRYAGTPLCYHFEETRQTNKGPVCIELGPKGDLTVTTLPIEPLHRVRKFIGTKKEILDLLDKDTGMEEYVSITITDQPIDRTLSGWLTSKLETRNSKLLELLSTWSAGHTVSSSNSSEAMNAMPVEDLFKQFYKDQNDNDEPDKKEQELLYMLAELLRNKPEESNEQMAEALKTAALKKEENA